MRFRFYDYLEVVIDPGKHRSYTRYFENEYMRIASDGGAVRALPVVRLEIVDSFDGDQVPGEIVRTQRFKKLFTFHYRIRGLDTNRVTIAFRHHPAADLYATSVGVYIQAHLLEPVMYFKMLEQGVLFMHAAGVSKDGKAHLFPAHGGTGKTTLSLSLLRKGYLLLGDDLLIVDPATRTVYPYKRPLHLFTYNIHRLKGAAIPRWLSIKIHLKDVLRFLLERILRTEFLISTRVHAPDIFPGLTFSLSAEYSEIIFLKKSGNHEVVELADRSSLLTHGQAIVDSADLNRSLYALLQEDSEKVRWIKSREIEVAINILQGVRKLEYVNVRLLDLDHPDELIAMLGR